MLDFSRIFPKFRNKRNDLKKLPFAKAHLSLKNGSESLMSASAIFVFSPTFSINVSTAFLDIVISIPTPRFSCCLLLFNNYICFWLNFCVFRIFREFSYTAESRHPCIFFVIFLRWPFKILAPRFHMS